jgi:cellulose synthase/poly-beta-1,6-N-acetylglucosamine synthase-like glycosyltransferase
MIAIWRGLQAGSDRRREQREGARVWPSVSVIIPAWQERGTLERCIHSLRLVSYPAWEVIIVAGGPDGTYQAAVEASKGLKHVQVIEQQPRGKNAALNEGVRAASGDVIVLLDADSTVSPGWLCALVAPLNGVIRATTGNPVPLRQTPTSRGEQMERISAWDVRNTIALQGCGSIAIRREVIKQIGWFPEDVFVGVDWDLDARLAARGVARTFCRRAVVYTERPATLREYWRNELRWRRAHLTSIIRLREHFLRDVFSAFKSLYLYTLAWFSVLLTCAAVAAILLGSPQVRSSALILWALFVAWVALRRAALAVEVAAYTRQAQWLSQVWVPPVLLFVTFVASCVASASIGRTTIHFKGPRSIGEKSP